MRIIHLLYDNSENPWLGGGAALRAKAVSDYFSTNGNSITFVSGGFPGCENVKNNDKIQFFFTKHFKKYVISRLLYSLQVSFAVKKLKKEHSFDILVEDMSIFNVIFPRLFWKGPMISLVHNYLGKQSFKKLGIFGIIPFLLERHYLKSRKNFIAVSNSLKKHILELNPSANVEVIYNGIDNQAFEKTKQSNAKKIGFIGRIEINQKGLDTLIQAFTILKKANFNFKALIIGGGKDEYALSQLISENNLNDCIELTGRLSEERFARLSECKIVCMPSRFEGWGIAAIESAAEGIPVIAANIEGLNEAVINQKTGILINANAKNLADEIMNLYADDAKLNEFSKNAQDHAKRFKWETISIEQLSFYKKIITAQSSSLK